jgi:hypothetical protein
MSRYENVEQTKEIAKIQGRKYGVEAGVATIYTPQCWQGMTDRARATRPE